MKRIEKVYFIAEFLSENFSAHSGYNLKLPFKDWMVIANEIVKTVQQFNKNTPNQTSSGIIEDYLSQNLVDAFKNPFEILEREFKNMRLGESSEWRIK